MLTRSSFMVPVLVAGLAMAGCAVFHRADARPVADDPVCKHNKDLGCIHVRVDEHTPRAVVGGKTYYFCSEACRAAFEREPGVYLSAGG